LLLETGDVVMRKGQGWFAIGVLSIFALALVVYLIGFDQVNASHIGVKDQFGVIQGTMAPGMQWTGLFVHVEQYDLRTRKAVVEMSGDESAIDKDGQSVFARIEVNYHLNSDSVTEAYQKVGRNDDMADTLNIDGIVRESFKTVTSEYSSLEIFQKREEVKERTIARVRANFPTKYFTFDNAVISNIDYNAQFKAAIEGKKTAQETAKKTEAEVQIAAFEANKKIEEARGSAESVKLAADAQAYERLAIARSEAESLKLKKEQITPIMVQNNWIDKWNGALPTYMIGGDGGTSLLFSMPTIKEGSQ
jgi:regulator of protease activity HflC (stomatin/prohibitin superfamily)